MADGRVINESRSALPVEERTDQREHWLRNSSSLWLFFPEVIPALGIVFASPIWLLSLLASGKIAAAVVLFIGVAGAAALAFAGLKLKSRMIVWGSVMFTFFAWYATTSVSSG